MSIQDSIQGHFLKRLNDVPVLVVYDQDGVYRDIVLSLEGPDYSVVDGSKSTILGRERAMASWRSMSADPDARLVIYLPFSRPRNDEQRQRNPYEVFSLGGGEFPSSDAESLQSLCRQAAPELADQIDHLFEAGRPPLEAINNLLEGGATWPTLKSLLSAESPTEIAVALLSPSESQEKGLKESETWLPELREFLDSVFGLKLKTRSKQISGIGEEMWRFVLFSEFAFDLPMRLPNPLLDVPRAIENSKLIIFAVCDTLRENEKYQVRYMDMTNRVERELQLGKHLQDISELGERDTFAFEERTHLEAFAQDVQGEKFIEANSILTARKGSIWVRHDSERQHLWTIAERALQLVQTAGDLSLIVEKTGNSLGELLGFYRERFQKLDQYQRAFEQAVTETYQSTDTLESLVEKARRAYLNVAEPLQTKFVTLIGNEGWPVSGIPRNSEVFSRYVASQLEERKKVAYYLVDALRYELAVELENELLNRFAITDLVMACAQLPTVTPVGMAALLPDADGNLSLVREQDKLIPNVKGQRIEVPKERYEYMSSVYGDRCHMVDLDDLLKAKKTKIPDTTQLLVIKTTDIDQIGEVNPTEARHILPRLVQKLLRSITEVSDRGFDLAIIATDHGFLLLDEKGIGDVVSKPPGDWVVVKDRCLLGKGSSGHNVRVFEKSKVGIAGDFDDYAVPTTFGTFRKGKPYYHAGLSLQECVLPVITVNLKTTSREATSPEVEIRLGYKGGTTDKITSRRPMIEIAMFKTAGLFGEGDQIEFRLEAYAKGNQVVGEVAASEHVSPSTNLVSIRSGEAIKVPLKMEEAYHGSFEVRAIDPVTSVSYDKLKLSTNYPD